MQNLPLTDKGESLSKLNRFLAGQKVLEEEHRFFQIEMGAYWGFRVLDLSFREIVIKRPYLTQTEGKGIMFEMRWVTFDLAYIKQ